jgi:hypothetical protein
MFTLFRADYSMHVLRAHLDGFEPLTWRAFMRLAGHAAMCSDSGFVVID